MAAGVEVAPYTVVNKEEDILNGLNELGYPAVLKTAHGGYDGKGQYVIRQQDELQEARSFYNQELVLLEKFIPYKKEISVIVEEMRKGKQRFFPLVKIFIRTIFYMRQLFRQELVRRYGKCN